MIRASDDNIGLPMNLLKEYLAVEWNSYYIDKVISSSEHKKEACEKIFGKRKISSWRSKKSVINKRTSKKELKPTNPKDEKEFLKFIYTLGIDPFLAFEINYFSWANFLHSLEGNISIGSLLNFGKIDKSVKFLDHFFAASNNYPSAYLEQTIKENHKILYSKEFTSDLEFGKPEIEKKILITPSNYDGQVIHFGYSKEKIESGFLDENGNSIKMYQFWQEYKFIFIRPTIDMRYFLEKDANWNEEIRNEKIKSNQAVKNFKAITKGESFSEFKKRAEKELYIVLVLNILGGLTYDFINKGDSFLIKTRFQEPKTDFKIHSIHEFQLELIEDLTNLIEIYENPC